MSKNRFMRNVGKYASGEDLLRYPVLFSSVQDTEFKQSAKIAKDRKTGRNRIKDIEIPVTRENLIKKLPVVTSILQLNNLISPTCIEYEPSYKPYVSSFDNELIKIPDGLPSGTNKKANKLKTIDLDDERKELSGNETMNIKPLAPDILARINQVYELSKTFTGEYIEETEQASVLKEVAEYVLKQINAGIDDPSNELHYSFGLRLNSVSQNELSEQRIMLLNSMAMKSYAFMRNMLLKPNFNYYSRYNTRKANDFENTITELQELEKKLSKGGKHLHSLVLTDLYHVEEYLKYLQVINECLNNEKPDTDYKLLQLKQCSLCGLLHYGREGGKKGSRKYCRVHTDKEIQADKAKHKPSANKFT